MSHYKDQEDFLILAEKYYKDPEFYPKKQPKIIEYSFNEDNLIQEVADYIDSTYTKHYAGGEYQAMEIITDAGYGMGFALGNVIKYSKRYGKKQGFNRDDLLKMIHYGFLALAVHDIEKGNNEQK